jgi:hypothetical protein
MTNNMDSANVAYDGDGDASTTYTDAADVALAGAAATAVAGTVDSAE